MTPSGLAVALAAGLLVGLGARLVAPRWLAPWQLTVPVGAGAAVLGTIALHLVSGPAPGFGAPDMVAPVFFAAIGVAMSSASAARHAAETRPQPDAVRRDAES